MGPYAQGSRLHRFGHRTTQTSGNKLLPACRNTEDTRFRKLCETVSYKIGSHNCNRAYFEGTITDAHEGEVQKHVKSDAENRPKCVVKRAADS